MVSILAGCFCAIVVGQIPIVRCKGSSRINIALYKPTNQSSTYKETANEFLFFKRIVVGSSDKAVDGGASNNFIDESCSHTLDDADPDAWWEVDLQRDYKIENVRILNRNTHQERLHDFKIDVFENFPRYNAKQCVTHKGAAGTGWTNLFCEVYAAGRFVRISKPKNNRCDVLTLCEVEIYGTPVPGAGGSKRFRRMSNASLQPRGEILTVHSITSCAVISLETGESAFIIVKEEKDGTIRCQKAAQVCGKGETRIDKHVMFFVLLD